MEIYFDGLELRDLQWWYENRNDESYSIHAANLLFEKLIEQGIIK